MIEYKRMSICSCSANLRAATDGLTWNPMIIAFDADANNTSDSVIAPTPFNKILVWILAVDNFCKESERASIDPSTSPLMMMLSSLKSPIANLRPISSSVICFCVRIPCSRCNCKRFEAISRASRSSSITLNLSPAWGAPVKPNTITGVAGPASLIETPRSLCIALIRPL